MAGILSGEAFAPGLDSAVARLIEIARLLRLTAGDPSQAERNTRTVNNLAVTDTAIVGGSLQPWWDQTVDYSTAIVTFTEASGRLRYSIDGQPPQPDGSSGVQIPSGGGILTVRGAQNIRDFQVVGETGQSGNMTVQLFQAPSFSLQGAL
jgi:hypothetical protein